MVGPARRVSHAARHQYAAARLDRRARAARRCARARRRLRRRPAGRGPGRARRACRRDRPGARERRSREAACRRERLGDRLPLRRRRGARGERARLVRCRDVPRDARARAGSRCNRGGLCQGGAARRHGVLLDDQPQSEELRARDRRRGVPARPAAARHARVREADPAGRARGVVPQVRARRHGAHGGASQPGGGVVLAGRKRRRELFRLRRARGAPIDMTADIWLYVALAAIGGLAIGLLIGLWRAMALTRELALKDAELRSRSAAETERERMLSLAAERLGTAFNQLADRQLQSHSDTFLKLARETLSVQTERAKGDLTAREQAIDGLVAPIREALARAERQLQELDKSRSETHGSISKQLEALAATQLALSAETRNLVSALRRPEVRGQWGEITLRRLVELAGMVEHCDFVTQSHQPTENGAVRPDLVVHLPEARDLVVDVKTPLDAYLEATEAATDAERRAALERHATIVAGRIRELAGKSYWSQFERSPEFVILFIPGDQFLSAALAERPTLLDDALRQNIILAPPTSLVALLKAVAYGWQQTALAVNAAEIRTSALQLYERLATFASHLGLVGKSLGDSVRAFNSSVGSLERMVLPSARRFTDLGVQPRQRLVPPKSIEELTRDVAGVDDPVPTATTANDGPH